MKKKIGLICGIGCLILICCLIALTFYGHKATENNSTQTEETSTPTQAEENAPSQQTDTKNSSITYINIGGGYLPVSCIENGVQLLSGSIGPYSMFADNLPEDTPLAESLPKFIPHDVDDISSSNQTQMLWPIASNGEWDFFPDKVTHQTYSIEEQPSQSDWVEYFSNRLTEINYDGPTVITESLIFEWDGIETAIVTASNIIVSDSEDTYDIPEETFQTAKQPKNDAPSIYMISALFIQGNSPLELFYQYIEISKEQETAAWLGTSYVPWDNNYSQYTQFISAIQYDESGGLLVFPISCNHGGELVIRDYKYMLRYLICDIDGDKKSEIIEYIERTSSSMCFCKVFKLTPKSLEESLYIVPN